MLDDDLVEDEPRWTAWSCLLTVAAIVLIAVLLVVAMLALSHAFGDLNVPLDSAGNGAWSSQVTEGAVLRDRGFGHQRHHSQDSDLEHGRPVAPRDGGPGGQRATH